MTSSAAIWLASSYGRNGLVVVPVDSKADGIAFLAASICEQDWSSYHAALTSTDGGAQGLSPVRTDNDPLAILQAYSGISVDEDDRFVLDDGHGEVVLTPVWRPRPAESR